MNEDVMIMVIGENHFPGFLHPIRERNCMAEDHLYLDYLLALTITIHISYMRPSFKRSVFINTRNIFSNII